MPRRTTFRRVRRDEQLGLLRILQAANEPAPAKFWGRWTRALNARSLPDALSWCRDCGRLQVVPNERISETGLVRGGKIVCPWAGCSARYEVRLADWDPTPAAPQRLPLHMTEKGDVHASDHVAPLPTRPLAPPS